MRLDPGRTGDSGALTQTTDRSNAVIRPPIAWALAFAAGLAINWLHPLHWIPATWPNVWMGVMVFAVGFALAIWARLVLKYPEMFAAAALRSPAIYVPEPPPNSSARRPNCREYETHRFMRS